jgi:hypothetical protein
MLVRRIWFVLIAVEALVAAAIWGAILYGKVAFW